MSNWKKNEEDAKVEVCHEWVEVIEERDERKGKEDINRGQKVFD